jgi:heavy metal translocating P-type ATPase
MDDTGLSPRLSFRTFSLPIAVVFLLLCGFLFSPLFFAAADVLGIGSIIFDSVRAIRKGRYSLDYVAFAAMVLALISGNPLAGGIVALMFTGGKALEAFASRKADAALRSLAESIPKEAFVRTDGTFAPVPLQEIREGAEILVKRGEIAPLDGTLLSREAYFDLANLTGEAGAVAFGEGVFIKSGAVNAGETVSLRVVGDFSSSTYHRIVELVEEAKAHPAPLVRLSERANIFFTISTVILAAAAYFFGDLTRALAVLVIATPCPLIIAAPVAFIGGMSRLARAGVIVRAPMSLEAVARASAVFFDKTGTLTLGKPSLAQLDAHDGSRSQEECIRIAASIEVHSLHPLARAIVEAARERGISFKAAESVAETVGEGISGEVEGARYRITGRDIAHAGITLALQDAQGNDICLFHFVDSLKEGTAELLSGFSRAGLRTAIITGDTKENAEELFSGIKSELHADASPEDKFRLIDAAHQSDELVVMVGDGLNDAPALAAADVGVVFSGSENGASIEAADVAVLDRNLSRIGELFTVSHTTMRIARQSIYGGIGLSLAGMVLASLGLIPPIQGAFIQEAIDVLVILNALRTLRA